MLALSVVQPSNAPMQHQRASTGNAGRVRIGMGAEKRGMCLRASASASLDVVKMSPLGDRILVKPKQQEEKSAGGVILAGSSNQNSYEDALLGTIVAVGEDVEIEVAAGDQVLYAKHGSSDIETEEGNVSFVVQKSILAKLS